LLKTVFIVDDNATNLVVAKNALAGSYKTFTLPSARKMFALAEKVIPDIILLDVVMPEMDGYEAFTIIKSSGRLKDIPVIFLTAKNNSEEEMRGFEMGAVDYLKKPVLPATLIQRIEVHLETDKLIKEGRKEQKPSGVSINVIENMVRRREKTTKNYIDRLQTNLAILVDALIRSGSYADEMSGWDLEILLPSAQLHDVGKIYMNDEILKKPGKLTEDEFNLVKRHCLDGERIIDTLVSATTNSEKNLNKTAFLFHAKRFAGSHHERWDGTGYPRGLAETQIPLEGRIMAVVDVYDALVFERPYKAIFSHEQSLDIIREGRGTHFDPKIVDAFLGVAELFSIEKNKSKGEKTPHVYKDFITPKVKETFCGEADKALPTLRTALSAGDNKLFSITVHSLKSALFNIGCEEAAAQAFALETAADNNDMQYMSAAMENFISALTAIVEGIRLELNRAAPMSAAAAGAPASGESFAIQLNKIKTACANFDDDAAHAALDRLAEISLDSETKSRLEKIRDALFIYSDFDAAHSMVKEMLASLYACLN
jgi:putative two-component system response regulator